MPTIDEAADPIEQMHSALVNIRTNCRASSTFGAFRKKVALKVLNIPNDIRIDDGFKTSCPLEIRTTFLDILYKTFKKIAENSDDGLLSRFLADHAHNIPAWIIKRPDGSPMTQHSLNQYWDCERPIVLFGLHGGNTQKKDYGSTWYKDLFANEWKVIKPFVSSKEVKYDVSTDWAGINPIKMQYIMREMFQGGKTEEVNVKEDPDTMFKQETDDEGDDGGEVAAKQSKAGWNKGFLL